MIDRLIGRPLHYAWLVVIVTFVNYAFVTAGALCLLAAGLSLRIGSREPARTLALAQAA
jgi:hypothetical protein